MAKIVEVDNLHNKIGEGTTIEGEIKSSGNLRVDGSVVGSIHSKGKVVIGPTGSVEGEITCQNADVIGSIKGKVTVVELLLLKATAKVEGDIVTGKLGIEPGANLSGTCNMGKEKPQINLNGQSNGELRKDKKERESVPA
ncbi:MAG: polymer-forming cytoskeletal protein [Flavobacteriales bacterium]|nr:polymer-forming cytoskeletal protein [Flavobacteriales bacterium]MCB9449678.1 polymer-forming cytoskeletal protein [Flavobacteriales bacterium]